VAREGWDQAVRLFAIVPTSAARADNPELSLLDDREYASLEQETGTQDVADLLAGIEWESDVVGAVVVMERVMVEGEPESLDDASPAQRHDVRMACAVLRTGAAMYAVRLRSHDSDDSVVVGPDLSPQLGELLLATFS
jgi:hypothetical protein